MQTTIKNKVSDAVERYYDNKVKAEISELMDGKFDTLRNTALSDEKVGTIVASKMTPIIDAAVSKNEAELKTASDQQVDRTFRNIFGASFQEQLARLADAAKNFVIELGIFFMRPLS